MSNQYTTVGAISNPTNENYANAISSDPTKNETNRTYENVPSSQTTTTPTTTTTMEIKESENKSNNGNIVVSIKMLLLFMFIQFLMIIVAVVIASVILSNRIDNINTTNTVSNNSDQQPTFSPSDAITQINQTLTSLQSGLTSLQSGLASTQQQVTNNAASSTSQFQSLNANLTIVNSNIQALNSNTTNVASQVQSLLHPRAIFTTAINGVAPLPLTGSFLYNGGYAMKFTYSGTGYTTASLTLASMLAEIRNSADTLTLYNLTSSKVYMNEGNSHRTLPTIVTVVSNPSLLVVNSTYLIKLSIGPNTLANAQDYFIAICEEFL